MCLFLAKLLNHWVVLNVPGSRARAMAKQKGASFAKMSEPDILHGLEASLREVWTFGQIFLFSILDLHPENWEDFHFDQHFIGGWFKHQITNLPMRYAWKQDHPRSAAAIGSAISFDALWLTLAFDGRVSGDLAYLQQQGTNSKCPSRHSLLFSLHPSQGHDSRCTR